jgi:hypothetical protein
MSRFIPRPLRWVMDGYRAASSYSMATSISPRPSGGSASPPVIRWGLEDRPEKEVDGYRLASANSSSARSRYLAGPSCEGRVHHQRPEGDEWQKPGAPTTVITAQAIRLSRRVVLLPTSEWDKPDELFRPGEPATQHR